jgi:hypothetical protein
MADIAKRGQKNHLCEMRFAAIFLNGRLNACLQSQQTFATLAGKRRSASCTER